MTREVEVPRERVTAVGQFVLRATSLLVSRRMQLLRVQEQGLQRVLLVLRGIVNQRPRRVVTVGAIRKRAGLLNVLRRS